MARKTKELTITAEGRDAGKVFKLTEMSADQAERWATRAFFAMANAGVELPDNVAEQGMAGLAVVALTGISKLAYEVAEPLLAEMLTCVKYVHAPGQAAQTIMSGEMCQIEEVKTFMQLRLEVLELHTGFSLAG